MRTEYVGNWSPALSGLIQKMNESNGRFTDIKTGKITNQPGLKIA